MREVLFRGKRIDNGEWLEGDLLTPTQEGFLQVYEISDTHSVMGDRYEVEPETVGQYTGLTDKNGKKIFEGDIIRIDSSCYDDIYITKVFDYNGTLCVDIWHREYDQTAIAFAFDDWDTTGDEVEVIGNIHDNPELLEGRNDD